MNRNIITFAVLMVAVTTHVWSLAIKSNDDQSDMKQSSEDVMKRETTNNDLRNNADIRRTYAMLLDSMPSKLHPFGFGLTRNQFFGREANRDSFPRFVQSRAFHGKKDYAQDDGTDDQNSSVFHGKRSNEIAKWLAANKRNAPPNSGSSKIFHGKKGMEDFMQYLLKDLENENSQVKK